MKEVLWCLLVTIVFSQRVVYKFDFNWKFQLGNVANEDLCPTNAFTTDMTDMYCSGWGHLAPYRQTEDECRLYCCEDPNCAGYSWRDSDQWCAVGNNLTGCVKQTGSGLRGGARSVPATIPQPPANGPQSVSYDDSKWESVSVPHDFIVYTAPNPNEEWSHGYRPKNISWYRKSFTLDSNFTNQVIWLDFDGVYRSSDMWLNGQFLGHHGSGYTSFRYRIDNFPGLKIGSPNILAVRVDPRSNEGWWYEGGGIYRHTWLVRTNAVHIARYGVYAPSDVLGAIFSSAVGPYADSRVNIYTTVGNTGASATFYVHSQISGPNASTAVVWAANSAKFTIGNENTTVYQTADISRAALWDTNSPSTYTLSSQIFDVNGMLLDNTTTTIGIRKLFFDANKGFYLNDQNVKVRGMCNHQDFAAVGTAVPDRINRFRIEKLQSFGVNAWRMSHNPPNPELLDWADHLGLLIWDENRLFGDYSQWYIDQQDLILRDRNHPSIIWWSLCNEWGCQQYELNVTLSIGIKFREVIRNLDATRPITGAYFSDGEQQWAQEVCDVMGINYNYGQYDPFHAQNPTIPLISSESCSCTSDRTYYINDTECIIGPYHAWSCIRDCWKPIATRDFVMGSFDWTGFDYRGEESPSEYPAINSHFGIVDLSGFSKDDVWYSQAWFFPDQPVVHILPQNWNFNVTPPSQSGSAYLTVCGSSPYLQWKFDTSATSGSTIESIARPGQCLVGAASGVYPAVTANCNTTNSAMLFRQDSYGQIYWIDSSNRHICLDVYGETGPQIGYYGCKNAGNTNQDWKVSGGTIASTDSNLQGSCIGFDDGSTLQVWVYTNGDSVELLLNGVSLGKQTIAAYDIGQFIVSYQPGTLQAVVTKNGKAWGNDTVASTTAATRLSLVLERPVAPEVGYSDGQDAALVYATILDASGRVVRDATNLVTFAVTSGGARVVGTGNGNPSDHTSDQSPSRQLWNGLVRGVIGFEKSNTNGSITITASSPGLTSSSVTINTQPRPVNYPEI